MHMSHSNLFRKAAKCYKGFSRILDTRTKMTIFRSIILSNCNYCFSISVAMFSLKNWKYIQNHGLFVYNDVNNTYISLLDRGDLPTLNINRLHAFPADVYKALSNHGPVFLQDIISGTYMSVCATTSALQIVYFA